MNDITNYNSLEFKNLLINIIKKRLSGSSVMSFEDVLNISKSINFTLTYNIQDATLSKAFEMNKEQIKKDLIDLDSNIRYLKDLNVLSDITGYQSVFKELEIFLHTYDVDYAAHETGHAGFDYQLAHPINDQEIKGINFVSNYVLCLKKEALFIKLIPIEITQSILNNYKKKMPYDYRIDINNLYEVIFNQLVAKELIKTNNTDSILLTKIEIDYLLQLNEYKLNSNFMDIIMSDKYYQLSYKKLIQKIQLKLTNQLLTETHIKHKNMSMKLNEPMNNVLFNQLVIELEQLPINEAAILVANKISSPYDLIDIFELHFFSNNDLQLIIKELSLPLIFQLLIYLKQESNESDLHSLLTKGGEVYKMELYRYIKQLDTSILNEIKYNLKYLMTQKQNYS